jgi:hypothetical protein
MLKTTGKQKQAFVKSMCPYSVYAKNKNPRQQALRGF